MKDQEIKIKKRAAILTNNLHCERLRQYFSTLEYYFRVNGWEIAEDFDVNLVVFGACGFHDTMYEKVLRTCDKLKEQHFLEKNIVVMGCLPKTHETQLAEKFHGQVIEYHQEAELDEIIKAKVPFGDIEHVHLFKTHKECRHIKEKYDHYYIKISEGCLKRCTYCVINRAKGALTSVPVETIEQDYKDAIRAGYRKIYLMGEDTFAYGIDTDTTIIDLVNRLLAIEPNVELTFGYLHNKWLIKFADSILDLAKKGILHTLHIGLQHVNEYILEQMGRGVRFNELYDILKKIKKEVPGFFLTTDIIVGFPGETAEISRELEDFFKQDQVFDKVCHFCYSDLLGTPSSTYDGKVPADEKTLRWERLNKILGTRSISNQAKEPDNIDDATFQLATVNDFIFCSDTFQGELKDVREASGVSIANDDLLREDDKDFDF